MIQIRTDRRLRLLDLTIIFVRERGRRQDRQLDMGERRLTLRARKKEPVHDWYRAQGGSLLKECRTLQAESVLVDFCGSGFSIKEMLQVVEGLLLADSSRNWTRSRAASATEMTVAFPDLVGHEEELGRIRDLVEAVQVARDLVLTSPNEQSPEAFAEQVRQLTSGASAKLQDAGGQLACTVLKRKQLVDKGMNLLLAVGAAGRDPVLVHATYEPEPPVPVLLPKVTLVGKGIVFDAGGLDLKPPAGMLRMKYDMAGAAAAVALFVYIVQRRLQLKVELVVPVAENLVDRESMRPGDIYHSYHGETVEITNTDAEGRLVLADALAWAAGQQDADLTVDLATLTGAATFTAGWNIVALGTTPSLNKAYLAAAMDSGEKAIELPLWDEYADELKSEVADLRNATNSRNAGTISAAKFVQRFAPEHGWLHLDIAAAAWQEKGGSYLPAGPTGAGIRSVAELLERMAEDPASLLKRKTRRGRPARKENKK